MRETRNPPLDEGLDRLTRWIETETGLCFPEVHHDTIMATAAARCRDLCLQPEDFEALLRSDAAEKSRFFNDIVIGETYFFRDERQFSALVSRVLPALLRDRRALRLWSATCATGEEAVSLVAAVERAKAAEGSVADFEVLATDINENALARLSAGVFPSSSFRTDGTIWHFLLDGLGAREGDSWRASAACLGKIQARHLNILTGRMPEPASVDVVFFRNTLVYMRQEQKTRVVDRIVETIRPGGCLFLSSPEVPTVRHPLLCVEEDSACFFFRKLAGPAALDMPAGRRIRNSEATAKPASTTVAAAKPAVAKPADLRAERSAAPSVVRRGTAGTGTTAAESAVAAVAGAVPAVRSGQSAGRAPRIRETDIVRGLALASARARAPGAAEETDSGQAVQEVAGMIEAIVAAIGGNNFAGADALLDDFEARASENHVSQYLRALARKHQGHADEARELWERARLYNQGFWPASFQAGLSYGDNRPERCRDLMLECLRAIEADKDGDSYFILLEGFDLPYYRRMAERQLARSRKP